MLVSISCQILVDELCALKMARAEDMIKLKPVIRHFLIQLGDDCQTNFIHFKKIKTYEKLDRTKVISAS
jgi:hypothetical protein